jgi:hypothetical protein
MLLVGLLSALMVRGCCCWAGAHRGGGVGRVIILPKSNLTQGVIILPTSNLTQGVIILPNIKPDTNAACRVPLASSCECLHYEENTLHSSTDCRHWRTCMVLEGMTEHLNIIFFSVLCLRRCSCRNGRCRLPHRCCWRVRFAYTASWRVLRLEHSKACRWGAGRLWGQAACRVWAALRFLFHSTHCSWLHLGRSSACSLEAVLLWGAGGCDACELACGDRDFAQASE